MRDIYSEEFKNVLIGSREEAIKSDCKLIHLEHFLLGILRSPNNEAYEIITQKVEALEPLRIKLIEHLQTYSKINLPADMPANAINLDMDAGIALQNSMKEAAHMGMEVKSTHLLLAILKKEESFASQLITEFGLTYDYLFEQLCNRYQIEDFEEDIDDDETLTGASKSDAPKLKFDDEDNALEDNNDAPYGAVDDRTNNDSDFENNKERRSNPLLTIERNKGQRPVELLKRFGTDLTAEAAKGNLDPVVGREVGIERLAQILSRRKKNNPILIGEAGVGKTAIVEGLAQRIVEGKVPLTMLDKQVFNLDMTAIVAGTQYRGQFEKRMQGLLKELKEHPEIIVFMDEIHTIIGAGSVKDGMDAANIFKPALARGQVQCIGATTIDEYRKSIEKDTALERRFQKIIVKPTSVDETKEILKNIKSHYERHHNVVYTDKALEACVVLTDRYISDRQLPDKAIDALDEAGSRKHIMNVSMPDSLTEIDQEMAVVTELRRAAVKEQHYEDASKYREQLAKLHDTLSQKKSEWMISLRENPQTVDENDVEQVVSIMSGVPVHKMAQTENIRLKNLKTDLQQTVIAQDKAIEKLVKAITRNRIGLRDPNKPIGTFLFLGPTGVGKTYLAKKLADYMFGSEDALIRIDMSEYMERHTTSRLIGAPPGYVGYEEGGQLTEKVRRRPYSIILLDELEKANRDVYNILLQIMDEGRLTDNNGVTVDFRNTIIIMTSNCGSRELQDFGNAVGFNMQSPEEKNAQTEKIIMKSLNRQFAPEFINRIDDIILFDSLNRDSIGVIVDKELEKLNSRLSSLGYVLEVDKKAKEFLVEKAYDRKYGARPLKRAIQTYVEDGISDFLLNTDNAGKTSGVIKVSHKKKKEELCFE